MAEYYRLKAEYAAIVKHVLVRCAFGASIGGMEFKRRGFVEPGWLVLAFKTGFGFNIPVLLEVPVYLVGRRIDYRGIRRICPYGLEKVEAPKRVDLKIGARAGYGCGHCDLTGEVEYPVRSERLYSLVNVTPVSYIAVDEIKSPLFFKPAEVV